MPSERSRRISSHERRLADGSKPVVGSSRNTSSGSPAIPTARSRRRCCPPERADARVALRLEVEQLQHLAGRTRVRVGGRVQLDRLPNREHGLDGCLLRHDPDALAQPAR